VNAPRIAPSIDRAELVRRAIEREVIRLHGAACVLHALRATPLDGLAWSRITADLDHARSLGERIDRLVILACAHMSMAEVDEAAVHLATLAGLSLDEWVMREGRAL
jgi:hypothetical protein